MRIKLFIFSVVLMLICSFIVTAQAQTEHSADDGHDHAAHAAPEPATCSEGHDHASEDHSGHGHEEEEIALSPQQQKVSGIQVQTAGPGNLNKSISLSGEVTLNSDSLVNHSSRASGIIVELNCSPGDYVRKGEVLAIIDSSELGQAKSEFYEIFNEVGCCAIDLQRFKNVAANATKLLNTLAKMPEISSLQKMQFGDMADYGAELLKAYAEYIINNKNFQRKSRLFKDKIVSENDYLISQNNYEKAMAEYFATRDNASFELKQKLLELERLMKVSEFKLRTAERKLQLLGLSHEEINRIRAHGAEIQATCTEPGCSDCSLNGKNHSLHTADTTFSQIAVKAGRSGTVTFREANLGEEVESNKTIFTVADTSNLWAILQASLKDSSLIKPGMEVTMQAPDGSITMGRVLLISPIVDEKTRTVAVRVALNNESRRWLPGSFITGKIKIAAENLAVLISRHAVQVIDGKSVVFVPTEHGYKVQEVKTGREDDSNVEIKSGLQAGQKYVNEGAFALKSVKITSTMDSHAGHGH